MYATAVCLYAFNKDYDDGCGLIVVLCTDFMHRSMQLLLVVGGLGDGVQQSYVSSSESAQNILANGIIGPLILEVCNC